MNRIGRVAKKFVGISKTKQQFKDMCTISKIVQKHGFNAFDLNFAAQEFGDVTNVPEYVEAQNIIAHAQQGFDALPAFIRKRFENNPANYLAFLGDENNRLEAEKMGLIEPLPIVNKSPINELEGTHIPEKATLIVDPVNNKSDLPQSGK